MRADDVADVTTDHFFFDLSMIIDDYLPSLTTIFAFADRHPLFCPPPPVDYRRSAMLPPSPPLMFARHAERCC